MPRTQTRRRPRSRSFPTTKSPAYRRSRPRRPICRPSPCAVRPSPAIMNMYDWERSACWPASTLLTGIFHASVEKRHRSREFIEFLKQLDAAPATAIKIILDNHSAHISKETKAWLAAQPEGRFTFVFTPKHGSWLNLVEGFFSK